MPTLETGQTPKEMQFGEDSEQLLHQTFRHAMRDGGLAAHILQEQEGELSDVEQRFTQEQVVKNTKRILEVVALAHDSGIELDPNKILGH
jgi:hypothetical protein